MTHRRAVLLMMGVTLMWSIAGIVTRHLDNARGFEITFWRSLFNALALLLILGWLRGPAVLWRQFRLGGTSLWVSGLCWAVMFTAFMVALTLTEVANVLVTMALAPLFTALAARLALGHRLAARTWAAIALAGIGIVWMYAGQLGGSDARHWIGIAVALCVPIAAAINWTLLQHLYRPGAAAAPDMLTPVLLGARAVGSVHVAAVVTAVCQCARSAPARPAGRGATGHPVPAGGARLACAEGARSVVAGLARGGVRRRLGLARHA